MIESRPIDGKQSSGCLGMGRINEAGGNELQRAGYEATFVVDEYIYYPDCGDGSVGLCMCHSLVNHTLNLCSSPQ